MTTIVRARADAAPLRSGGWLVNLGHDTPTWVADRQAALDLLDPVGHPADCPGAGAFNLPRADVAAGPTPDSVPAATQHAA